MPITITITLTISRDGVVVASSSAECGRTDLPSSSSSTLPSINQRKVSGHREEPNSSAEEETVHSEEWEAQEDEEDGPDFW